MPFIKKVRRDVIERCGLDGLPKIEPGDRCYVHYKNMVDRWHEDLRWTTAHDIYREMFQWFEHYDNPDDAIAYRLAWEVFFFLHVMPYEIEKRKLNGDI
jgi:hypothetical protein